MQEIEITLQSVHGRDGVVKIWHWDAYQFASKPEEVLLGRPPGSIWQVPQPH